MIPANIMRLAIVLILYIGGICLMLAGHFWLGTLLHFIVVAPVLYGTLNPHSALFGPIQRRPSDQRLWLTLDDGPDPIDTPAVLDLLRDRGVKATFFVIGEKAQQRPELIKRIIAEGHQLGNHTQSHPQGSFWCLGPLRTSREIERCQNTLKEITGDGPKIFRAPVGHHNLFVHPILKRHNMRLVGWTARGLDGVSKDIDTITTRLQSSITSGSIILAHEGTGIAKDIVTSILDHAEENKWEFIDPMASSPRSESY